MLVLTGSYVADFGWSMAAYLSNWPPPRGPAQVLFAVWVVSQLMVMVCAIAGCYMLIMRKPNSDRVIQFYLILSCVGFRVLGFRFFALPIKLMISHVFTSGSVGVNVFGFMLLLLYRAARAHAPNRGQDAVDYRNA